MKLLYALMGFIVFYLYYKMGGILKCWKRKEYFSLTNKTWNRCKQTLRMGRVLLHLTHLNAKRQIYVNCLGCVCTLQTERDTIRSWITLCPKPILDEWNELPSRGAYSFDQPRQMPWTTHLIFQCLKLGAVLAAQEGLAFFFLEKQLQNKHGHPYI